MRIVASRLRAAIARAGYSQSSFAAACEISRPIINKLCNDRYEFEPSDYTLQRIAYIANVTPDYLTGKEGFDPVKNLSKEEQARRALFDLLTAAGNIEPIPDGRGRFRLSGRAGSVEMSETEMQVLVAHFQRRLESMCNEYIELCAVHDRGQKSK